MHFRAERESYLCKSRKCVKWNFEPIEVVRTVTRQGDQKPSSGQTRSGVSLHCRLDTLLSCIACSLASLATVSLSCAADA